MGENGIRECWTPILCLGHLLAPLWPLVSAGLQSEGGRCQGGIYLHRCFPANFGISLAGNAASKPHLSGLLLALGRELASTAIQFPLSSPWTLSGQRGVGRKAPTVCMGWKVGRKSQILSCLANCTLSLISAQRDWDLSYASPFQNRAWSGTHEQYGNLHVKCTAGRDWLRFGAS